MPKVPLKLWLLVLLSAVLQIVIFPVAGPLPLWRAQIAWVALVPLLVAVGDERLRIRDAAWLGYACGAVWYLGTCYWIYSTMHVYGGLSVAMSALAMVLFCMYLGLYHALFAALFATMRKHVPNGRVWALLAAPVLWCAVEFARARVTGFPWNPLGASAVDNPWLMFWLPVGGSYAVSFALVLLNAALAARIVHTSYRLTWVLSAAAIVSLVGGGLGNVLHVRHKGAGSTEGVAVALQPNLAVGASGPQQPYAVTLQEAMRLTNTEETRAITLWPESPSEFNFDDPLLRQQWTLLANNTQAPLIANALRVAQGRNGLVAHNSAAYVDPAHGVVGYYDKMHLVPFGEYVPFASMFSWASGLTQAVGNFAPGRERTLFHTGGHAYGTFICYESIFGDEIRELANNGAEVLINLSDDGWYGDSSAPFQHMNMVRMRAIENRRWIVRDTNTGITASIDPNGEVQDAASRHELLAARLQFGYSYEKTFYTKYGDVFAWACALLSVVVVGYAVACKMKLC